MTNRRGSPLKNLLKKVNSQDSETTTSQTISTSQTSNENIKFPSVLVERFEDYLYLRQGVDRYLTKQELYIEAIKFFLNAKGDIPAMPLEAREKLNQKKGRNKK